jgi:hypothetical protein
MLLRMVDDLAMVYQTVEHSSLCYIYCLNINPRNLKELAVSAVSVDFGKWLSHLLIDVLLYIVPSLLFSMKVLSYRKNYSPVFRICLISQRGKGLMIRQLWRSHLEIARSIKLSLHPVVHGANHFPHFHLNEIQDWNEWNHLHFLLPRFKHL